jgi:hypothetical protein
MAKRFEEGCPTLLAGRFRYTSQEKIVIYSTPFAIQSVKQTSEGFVLEQNLIVKLLPTGLVRAIPTKTEQSLAHKTFRSIVFATPKKLRKLF